MCLESCCTIVEKSDEPSRWQDSGSLNVVDHVPCWIRVSALWSGRPGLKFQLRYQVAVGSWASY